MKKGFTMIELLAVIGIIGVIALIAIPYTIGLLNDNINNTMKIQEIEIEDSAVLYLEDYCKTPIDDTYICPLEKTIKDDIVYYNGDVKLDTLVTEDYIGEITARNSKCSGKIVFTDSVPKVFLECGEVYKTE